MNSEYKGYSLKFSGRSRTLSSKAEGRDEGMLVGKGECVTTGAPIALITAVVTLDAAQIPDSTFFVFSNEIAVSSSTNCRFTIAAVNAALTLSVFCSSVSDGSIDTISSATMVKIHSTWSTAVASARVGD
jgi:hypothetical protein